MDKKILSMTLLSLLLIAAYVPIASAHNAPFPGGYDPTHLVIETIGGPETIDPAWCYDTASAEIISAMYDTLIFFDNVWTDGPYNAGKTDEFVYKLATSETVETGSWPGPGGITFVKRFTYTIRTGVKFHDGSIMTPEDIEYSFERWMVQDRDGGPQWMIYEPLLGSYGAESYTTDANFGAKIDACVESTADSVVFYFASWVGYPEMIFRQVIAQSWAGIVKKSWAVAQGDFDGDFVGHTWQYIWETWHNPETSFIEGSAMGTGPYKLSYWTPDVAWSILKFADYWDGWPARISLERYYPSYRAASSQRLPGSLDKVTWYEVPDWTARRATFLAGGSDMTAIDRQYRDQVLGQVVGGEKVRCFYPFGTLACTNYFFTFTVSETQTTPLMYDPNPADTYSAGKYPINFFEDINARKGVAYLFDYNSWLAASFLGEGYQPPDSIIDGLAYDLGPDAPAKYYYDMTKAADYLKQVGIGAVGDDPLTPEGALWDVGIKFTVSYNTGNVGRQTAAEMIASKMNSLNTKFVIDTTAVSWGSVYLPKMVARELPIFIIGWLADYPDPHNFAVPFYYKYGTFAEWQGYDNPTMNALIEDGIETPDGPARAAIYSDIQYLAVEDVPSVALVQATGRHWEQGWVRGWYNNKIYPGIYPYHHWKAKTHFGDANNDGAVNVGDVGVVSAHWTGPPAGVSGYNPRADMTGGTGGTTGSSSGLVKGIWDGKVSIADAGLISAYWDGPPKGPSHP